MQAVGSGGNEFDIRRFTDGNFYNGWFTSSTSYRAFFGALWTAATWLTIHLDWVNGGALNCNINNIPFGSASSIVVFSTVGDSLILGNASGGGKDCRGQLAEWRLRSRVITAAERGIELAGGNISTSGQLNRLRLLNDLVDSWGSATAVATGTSFSTDSPPMLVSPSGVGFGLAA